ncbi:MAG: hypothetical protein AAF662_04055 [Pseudomonadota bacterium]
MQDRDTQLPNKIAKKVLATVACALAGLVITGVLYLLTEHPEQSRACNAALQDVAAIVMSDNLVAKESMANRAVLKRGLCAPSDNSPPP